MSRKRALIVKFGAIGDVIMAIPAAHALSQQGFQVDWMCGAMVLPLLATYSWIRPVPVDDKAIFRGTPVARALAIAKVWKLLASTRYDLCATLYYDRRYRLLTWPIRAPHKLELARDDRAMELLPGRHHTDEFVRIVLGAKDSCREQSSPPVRPDRLPPSPLPATTAPRRVALVPGGTSNLIRQQILRRWPIESYVAVAAELIARGWEVVLLGGPEDVWVRPHFAGLEVTDILGQLTLAEVVSLCDACDLVVSHDTGPLHLAGLSATPLIGLFGPTDPSTRVPRRPYAVGLWGGQGFACRPCYDGVDFAPCEFNGCMHTVTPTRVLHEIDRLLVERDQGLDNRWRVAEE